MYTHHSFHKTLETSPSESGQRTDPQSRCGILEPISSTYACKQKWDVRFLLRIRFTLHIFYYPDSFHDLQHLFAHDIAV